MLTGLEGKGHVMVTVELEPEVVDLEISHGYVIRGSDLRGHITDADAFRRGHAGDGAAEVIIALSEQRYDDAMAILDDLLTDQPDSVRYQALRADVLRDQGHLDAAEAIFTDLVARTSDDPHRGAMMRQHRAKVWFHQGRLREAEAEFADVLAAREAAGADEDQVASSRQSLQRVRLALAAQDN